MTDKEILQKAIKKAEKNGLTAKILCKSICDNFGHNINEKDFENIFYTAKGYYSVIFNHDFAKAFWGDRLICYDCGAYTQLPISIRNIQIGTGTCTCSRQFENNIPVWEYRIQEMVLEKEPLKYIEKFL